MRLLIYSITAAGAHYFASLVQVLCHRAFGHRRTIDKLYRVHAKGHHAKYPAEQLRSSTWIPNEEHITWYYAFAFAPFIFASYLVAPLDIFSVFVTSLGASVWMHIYLHRQYHLEATWLTKFKWFRRKQYLHFVHHRRVHRNYAILEFFWDKLLKTYCDKP